MTLLMVMMMVTVIDDGNVDDVDDGVVEDVGDDDDDVDGDDDGVGYWRQTGGCRSVPRSQEASLS